LDYDGQDPGVGILPKNLGWTFCADGLEFPSGGEGSSHPDWPDPGSGNRMTFNTCQLDVVGRAGVHAVFGFFYVYAYSSAIFQVTPNTTLLTGTEFKVADCLAAESKLPIQAAGSIGFFNDAGFNSCWGIDPTEPSTWGNLKMRYAKREAIQ